MKMMKPCEEITLDFEKSKFVRLSLKDRMILRAHVMMCSKCHRYLVDSRMLDTWLAEGFSQQDMRYRFSESEKERLRDLLG